MVSPSQETSQKKRLPDLEINSDSAKTQGTLSVFALLI